MPADHTATSSDLPEDRLNRLLQTIVADATDLVGARAGLFGIVDRSGSEPRLVYREWYRDHTWELIGDERGPWEGLAGRALATGRPQVVPDLAAASPADRRDAGRDIPPSSRDDVRNLAAIPVPDREGAVVAVLIVFDKAAGDLSPRDLQILNALAGHAALVFAYGELRREEAARQTHFLGMVAHELKNPLTPLRINLQLLRRRLGETVDQPPVARALGTIGANLDRLQSRIDDLQRASHIGSGAFTLDPQPCDLADLARQVVDEQLNTTLGQAHELPLSAPDTLAGVWDRDRLHQTLTNLVTNALKYSPAGTVVAVEVRRDGDRAVVTVTDQGVGFRPEDVADLFRPYSRLYQASQVKGTGLGLFIVKGIVEAHGGHVWTESAGPGRGSRFGFELPLGEGPGDRV